LISVGCAGVIQCATDLSFSSIPDEVIKPTVNGLLHILNAAAKVDSIKRFVFTSSSAAIWTPRQNVEITFTEKSWNDEDVLQTNEYPNKTLHPLTVYAASKVHAEQAMWKFVAEEKPGFQVSSVLPETVLGTIIDQSQASRFITGVFPRMIYHGNLNKIKDLIPPRYYINAADCALLHVACLALPQTAGHRVFAYAKPYNWNLILKTLRECYPERTFDKDLEGLGNDMSRVPNAWAEEILSTIREKVYGTTGGWVPFKQTITQSLVGMD
jgi:nucleoside-diphosphate-sugar epimerase